MESAPQSTITHNAVIEFASDLFLFPTPRLSPRERRAHKKRALPCPKGRPQIGRDLAKIIPRAQRREGRKRSISPCICSETGAFRQNARNGYRTGAGARCPCPVRPRIGGAPDRRGPFRSRSRPPSEALLLARKPQRRPRGPYIESRSRRRRP